ncbi:MAG: hypothetical protein ACRC1K_06585, partial [Planctomycetia bacterium]
MFLEQRLENLETSIAELGRADLALDRRAADLELKLGAFDGTLLQSRLDQMEGRLTKLLATVDRLEAEAVTQSNALAAARNRLDAIGGLTADSFLETVSTLEAQSKEYRDGHAADFGKVEQRLDVGLAQYARRLQALEDDSPAKYADQLNPVADRLSKCEDRLDRLAGRIAESDDSTEKMRMEWLEFGERTGDDRRRLLDVEQRGAELVGLLTTTQQGAGKATAAEMQSVRDQLAQLENQGRRLGEAQQSLTHRVAQMEASPVEHQLDELRKSVDGVDRRLNAEVPAKLAEVRRRCDESEAGVDATGKRLSDWSQRIERWETDTVTPTLSRLDAASRQAAAEADLLRERSDELEGQARRGRRRDLGMMAAILAAAAVGVAGLWQPHLPRTVTAERFLLRDPTGRIRADLGAFETGTGLWLYDENSKNRLWVGVSNDGVPELTLRDEAEKPRWAASVADGPGLAFLDEAGATRAALAAAGKEATLRLHDAQGAPRVLVGVGNAGDGVNLFDPTGKMRVGLGIAAAGATLNLFDVDGKRRLVVS